MLRWRYLRTLNEIQDDVSIFVTHLKAGGAEPWLVKKGGEMTSFDTNELLDQLNCLAELQFQIGVGMLNFSF